MINIWSVSKHFVGFCLFRVGQMIREAVQDIDIYTDNDFTNSQNYNLSLGYESVQAAVFSNIIFDPSSQLPREVMLETTLKAFGFYANIWEVKYNISA